MATHAERFEFTPPPQPGALRSLLLALGAHLLLVVALALGVQWKRDARELSAEAELWASVPRLAAPREVAASPPEPRPAPAPPPPLPPAPPAPAPAPPPPRQADIAAEREQAQRDQEARERRLAQERQRREAQQKLAEQRREQQARLAAEQRRKEEERKRREADEARRLAELREENLKRMQGLAGASGAATAQGSATQSAGPSDSYAGRIRARVKPNIVFTEDLPGNPETVVNVRLAPDGTIVGKRIVKSSGSKAWDDAVLRALDRTEVLPRDVDGRVHSPMDIVFRLRD